RVDDPEVALLGRLDARHPVLQAVRRAPRPEILRRVHMGIRRDDALAAHRSILLLVADDEERFSVAPSARSNHPPIVRRAADRQSPATAVIVFAMASRRSPAVLAPGFALVSSFIRVWRRPLTNFRALAAFLPVPETADSFPRTCLTTLPIFFLDAFFR